MRIVLLAAALIGCASRAPEGEPASEASPASTTPTSSAPSQDLHGTRPARSLPAPEFAALNRDGTPRGKEHLVGNPTVMWFFPKAATAG